MRSLSEFESKQLLVRYGVPVITEVKAKDIERANGRINLDFEKSTNTNTLDCFSINVIFAIPSRFLQCISKR